MDGRQFDNLARRFGALASRRTALKGLLGGAVAVATGAAVAIDDADAIGHSRTCNPGYGRCAHHADCCSGVCETQVVRRGRQRVRVGRCTVSCAGDGGSCGSDGDCCSGMCYEGTCLATCQVVPTPGNRGVYGCDSDADCCSGYCNLSNVMSGYYPGGVCQNPLGGACAMWQQCQSGCCQGQVCVDSASCT